MDEPLIPVIYEAALEPERWGWLFTQLSEQLGGAAVYLGQSRTDRFGTEDFWTVGVDPSAWDRFSEIDQAAQSNRTLAALLRCEGRVVDRRAIIPDTEVSRDPLSRTFLSERGLFHAVISVVQRDEDVASTFWVARDRAHPIEAAAFERLRLLAPHVGQAMHIHLALGRSTREAATFRRLVENLERGVALLDKSLCLLYANAAAERALDADSGLGRRLGQLFAKAPRSQRAFEALVRRLTDPRGDLAGGTLLVPDLSARLAWRVTLAPAVGPAVHGFAHRARVVAFIDDLSRNLDAPDPETLAAQFGLTPAESRVAALAARALRPAEIARALGVSVNTVKSQLKGVHGRLGVRTQAELVRLMLSFRDH